MEIVAMIDAAAVPGVASATALDLVRRAGTLAEESGDMQRVIRALLVESDIHYFGGGVDAAVKAENAALLARDAAVKAACPLLEGAALNRLLRAAKMRGDRATAFAYGERNIALARALHEKENNSAPLAGALNGVAVIFLDAGNYLVAQSLLAEGLEWARLNRQNALETFILSNIALIKSASGQYHEAAATFAEIARRHALRGRHAARIKALGNFAHNALAEARYAEAEAACIEALEAAAAFGVRQTEPRIRTLHGKLLRLTNCLDEAETTLKIGYEQARGAGDRQRLPLLRAEQGLVAHARNDNQAAIALLDEALLLSGETERASDTLEIFQYLAIVSEASGDSATALHYYKEHYRASQKLEAAAAARRYEASLFAVRLGKAQLEMEAAQREASLQRRRQQQELNETNQALTVAIIEKRTLLEELREQARLLAELADKDPLTNLYNRCFMDRRLPETLKAAEQNVSVAVIDIDNFKPINDRFSHETGDFVLRIVSHLIRENIRPGDVLARYGGDKFVFVLNHIGCEDASAVCERLRKAIGAYPWRDLYRGLGVTISVGISHSGEANTAEKLIAIAGDRLYKAKAAGKNRVVFAHDMTTSDCAEPGVRAARQEGSLCPLA